MAYPVIRGNRISTNKLCSSEIRMSQEGRLQAL